MKKTYTIYGLSVKGQSEYFYIGVTQFSIEYRLAAHLSSVKSRSDSNKKKCQVIIDNKFRIISTKLAEVTGTKQKGFDLEKEYILKYTNDGHPLTNRIAGPTEDYVTIKISPKTHQELKLFCAIRGENMGVVASQAILKFLREMGHEFIYPKASSSKPNKIK